jgi:hypothetical protein
LGQKSENNDPTKFHHKQHILAVIAVKVPSKDGRKSLKVPHSE